MRAPATTRAPPPFAAAPRRAPRGRPVAPAAAAGPSGRPRPRSPPPPPRATPLLDAELVDVTSLPPGVGAARAALEALTSLDAVMVDLAAVSRELDTMTAEDEAKLDAARQKHAAEGAARRAAREQARAVRRAAARAPPAAPAAPPSPPAPSAPRDAGRKAAMPAPPPAVRVLVPGPGRGGAGAGAPSRPTTSAPTPAAAASSSSPRASPRAAPSPAPGGGARAAAAARTRAGRGGGGGAAARRGGGAFAAVPGAAAAPSSSAPSPRRTKAAAAAGAKAASPPSSSSSSPAQENYHRLAPLARSIARHPLLDADGERVLATRVQAGIALDAVRAGLVEAAGPDAAPPSLEAWAAAAALPSVAALKAELARARAARDKMVGSNTRLVISVARRYMGKGLELEDLVLEGLAGLLRGVEKFDPTRGFKFSTYAHWWIRQAVTRAISEQGRIVRLPVHLHEQMARVRKAEAELAMTLGRAPTPAESSAAAGLPAERIAALKKMYHTSVSLDLPAVSEAGGDSTAFESVGDGIEDESLPCATASAVATSLSQDLEAVLATLGARERGVLRMRYGLDDGRPKTLEEIGTAYAVTRERIRQIEAKALLKLRQPARAAALVDYADDAAGASPATAWKSAKTKMRGG